MSVVKESFSEETCSQKKARYHPYSKCDIVTFDKSVVTINGTKFKDTGGGFLLEETVEKAVEPPTCVATPAPVFPPDRPTCTKCNNIFSQSWLFDTFDYPVCDDCKDPEEEHRLITKTEALKEYLLKDCDLEKREPSLKFIKKKNPHNQHWGDMKLYLQIQVEERALEVWGSQEKLEEQIQKREEKKVMTKSKKYQKQMKELRMAVRSSLYNKTSGAGHKHDFGAETYNEEEDNYSRVCTTCNVMHLSLKKMSINCNHISGNSGYESSPGYPISPSLYRKPIRLRNVATKAEAFDSLNLKTREILEQDVTNNDDCITNIETMTKTTEKEAITKCLSVETVEFFQQFESIVSLSKHIKNTDSEEFEDDERHKFQNCC
ncbi:hypothetical protein RN001_012103 [Aquatica leii]|uniref:XPA C-terminal domain-containing protein n=1 Tax=Aquatica leii TaxID=1421715 RepID=A0AAN7P5F7_9COLE|nr:hypothetical protein RN001_012103 [Aquatica leii]